MAIQRIDLYRHILHTGLPEGFGCMTNALAVIAHRVIAAGGGLGGYSGGLEVKRFLLRLEAGLPLPADR